MYFVQQFKLQQNSSVYVTIEQDQTTNRTDWACTSGQVSHHGAVVVGGLLVSLTDQHHVL